MPLIPIDPRGTAEQWHAFAEAVKGGASVEDAAREVGDRILAPTYHFSVLHWDRWNHDNGPMRFFDIDTARECARHLVLIGGVTRVEIVDREVNTVETLLPENKETD